MKILLTSILTFFSVLLFAQDENVTAIKAVMHKQEIAWNNADIDGFMQGYWKSDSLMFIGGSGPTYGWQTTLNNYKKRYPDTAHTGHLTFDILEVRRLSSDYYFLTGKWFLKRSVGDVGGYYTLLLRKIKGEWVIVIDHTS
jgi:ketosteroid isomerase-like protein